MLYFSNFVFSAQIISASASLPFAWTGNSQLLASCNFTGNSQVLLDLQDVDVNVQNVQIAENVADAELVNLGGTRYILFKEKCVNLFASQYSANEWR